MTVSDPTDDPGLPDTRARILAAAIKLITEGGVAALTTRAVATAAAVQAPTLYRLFDDKRGLLDAVAEHGLAAYAAGKAAAAAGGDPVQDLRDAFNEHVAFGLENPAVFAIMNEVGRDAPPSPATRAGLAVLRERVHRVAQAGRLRVPKEQAVSLIQAVCNGTIATLLSTPAAERDAGLSAAARDVVVDAVADREARGKGGSADRLAIGLRSHLAALDVLTPGERLLLDELLDRISEAGPSL